MGDGASDSDSSSDDDEGDEYDRVGARLEKERLITKGKYYRFVFSYPVWFQMF